MTDVNGICIFSHFFFTQILSLFFVQKSKKAPFGAILFQKPKIEMTLDRGCKSPSRVISVHS